MAAHGKHMKGMPPKAMKKPVNGKALPAQASETAKARAFGQQGAAKRKKG